MRPHIAAEIAETGGIEKADPLRPGQNRGVEKDILKEMGVGKADQVGLQKRRPHQFVGRLRFHQLRQRHHFGHQRVGGFDHATRHQLQHPLELGRVVKWRQIIAHL